MKNYTYFLYIFVGLRNRVSGFRFFYFYSRKITNLSLLIFFFAQTNVGVGEK